MKTQSADPRAEFVVGYFALREGEVLRIEDPRCVLAYVARGSVWITQERVLDDLVLGSGESTRLARRGVALVAASEPSSLLLTAPDALRWARRVDTRLPLASLRTAPAWRGWIEAIAGWVAAAGRSAWRSARSPWWLPSRRPSAS